jgi:transketolase
VENLELNSVEVAREARKSLVSMTSAAQAAHTGSSLSIVDILSVIYTRFVPSNLNKDSKNHVFVSKGHAAAGTYAVMAHANHFDLSLLETYGLNGSALGGHVTKHETTGVELSTGSLGHALPFAVGVALADRLRGRESKTFVVLSDGECDEGSNWEAALVANHLKLSSLIVCIDRNYLQSMKSTEETISLEPLDLKWASFGWNIQTVDGHDHADLHQALELAVQNQTGPSVIICKTTKGKGVSFMENQVVWHYRPPSLEDVAHAHAELNGEKK